VVENRKLESALLKLQAFSALWQGSDVPPCGIDLLVTRRNLVPTWCRSAMNKCIPACLMMMFDRF
jgi:hypothetical protein